MIRAHRMGGGRRRGAVVKNRGPEEETFLSASRILVEHTVLPHWFLWQPSVVWWLHLAGRCSERKTSVFHYLLSGYGSTGHGLHCKLSPTFITRAAVTLLSPRQTSLSYILTLRCLCIHSLPIPPAQAPVLPYWHCIRAFSQRIG